MLYTTPESLQETQPYRDESGDLVLIYDGRVDNREELHKDFAAHGLAPRNPTDAELLLRAYQRWGEDFPVHVIGDFAVIVWDARRRTLFCARASLVVPSLCCIFPDGRHVLCASDVRQFFAFPHFTPRPNEGMIAGYLASRFGNNHETLYQGFAARPRGPRALDFPASAWIAGAIGISIPSAKSA